MEEYDIFLWDRDDDAFYRRHRLSNGQYCMVKFVRYRTDYYNVYYTVFAVADKKKKLAAYFNEASGNTITLKTTGRCGLEALVWCYRTMVDFEGYLADFSVPSKVAVIGEDQRRFRAYEKALSKKGYQKVFLDGQWTMLKTIVA